MKLRIWSFPNIKVLGPNGCNAAPDTDDKNRRKFSCDFLIQNLHVLCG